MPWQCRFVCVDPLAGKYAFYTPYQYAGNKPIVSVDLDGLEGNNETYGYEWNTGNSSQTIATPSPSSYSNTQGHNLAVSGVDKEPQARKSSSSSGSNLDGSSVLLAPMVTIPGMGATGTGSALGAMLETGTAVGSAVEAGTMVGTAAETATVVGGAVETGTTIGASEAAAGSLLGPLLLPVVLTLVFVSIPLSTSHNDQPESRIRPDPKLWVDPEKNPRHSTPKPRQPDPEDKDHFDYFYRAMSWEEFTDPRTSAIGLAVHGTNWVADNVLYLTMQQSFVNQNDHADNYDLIVRYKMILGTGAIWTAASGGNPSEGAGSKSGARNLAVRKGVPLLKFEGGGYAFSSNYGFYSNQVVRDWFKPNLLSTDIIYVRP